MNDLSKWLDFWLQTLKPFIPTYIKDSQQVLSDLSTISLPPTAKLFTTDANSMYNNIDTRHALQVISQWIKDLSHRRELPANFPVEAVLDAMALVMRNNLFEWGDLYFLQLVGTAMGTSAAVMWATLYYGYHEVHTILPKHSANLLYFKRFIDDIFGIWIGTTEDQWHEFCTDIDNFGILTWDIKQQRRSQSVNFLDLTLTIEGSRVISRTFQKDLNLYLYLPPYSAHPPGVLKGTLFGLIRRYYAQNTYREDYVRMVRLLYHRFIQRGWKKEQIAPLIQEICTTLERPNTRLNPPPERQTNEKLLFIHLAYHPDDIPRKRIRALYDTYLAKTLKRRIGITRPVIAYSRLSNIREHVTKARLHQPPGLTASALMGELREAQQPPQTPPPRAPPNPTPPQNPNPTTPRTSNSNPNPRSSWCSIS
jgi:hypothetical protein